MPTETLKDERGAEYLVTKGFGKINSITWPEEGKRNAHVEITPEGNLQYPVKGWADSTDPDIHSVLVDQPDRVEYRVETHREQDLDPSIPIEEVDKRKKFRRMIVLKRASANGNREVPNEPPAQPGPKANDAPGDRPAMRSGGDRTDTWAYGATLGLAELAFELLVAAGGAERGQLNPKTVKGLAERLLAVADGGQECVRAAVDRNANSHTRARGALRSALALYPVPLDMAPVELDEALDAWQERMTRAVCLLMRVGLELLDPPEPSPS